jgi:hypothetical protein
LTHQATVRTLTTILRADNEARPVLLLGAGASFSSQIPMAEQSVKLIARRVFAERQLGGKVAPYQVRQTEWLRWLANHPWFISEPERLAENFPLVVEHLLRPQDYRRRQLLELLQLAGSGVSTGYEALTELVMKGLVRTVMTTNFDACLPTALAAQRAHLSRLCEVNRTPGDLREFDLYARAQIIWLHGRVESYGDRNSGIETQSLDDGLKAQLIPLLRFSPLVVVGYRGAERSVSLDLLLGSRIAALDYPRGIYWCTRAGEALHSNVQQLADAIGPNFQHLEITGFDELMSDLKGELRDEDCYSRRLAADTATGQEPFADRPAKDATLDEIDQDLALATLQAYCANLRRPAVTRDTLVPLLRELRLVVVDHGTERPTNGCILLFAKNLERWFPHAIVSASIGGKKRSVFEGNLLMQRRALLSWSESPEVNPFLKVKKIATHTEEPAYAPRAMVELLVNMIVHRDYEHSEPAVIRVAAGAQIEFSNPGGLADEIRSKVAVDADGRFTEVPEGFARNRALCDVFTGIRAMEWRGTGLPDVIKLAKDSGGEARFGIDAKGAFVAAMTQRATTGGVARSEGPTGAYVLNSLPFITMPAEIAIVVVRGQICGRSAPDLDEAGTYVITRDGALFSFTPLPMLRHALGQHFADGRMADRRELERDPDRRRVLSWLLRRHFERHLATFHDDGFELEEGRGSRAFFVGDGPNPRALRYDSSFRRNVRREVVKRRAEGERAWFENEGIGYEVKSLGDAWAIRVKPFYMFTGADARTPLPSFARTARATRRMKFDRNESVDSDLAFWARFLSRGQPTINIGQQGTSDLLLDGAFLSVELPEPAGVA